MPSRRPVSRAASRATAKPTPAPVAIGKNPWAVKDDKGVETLAAQKAAMTASKAPRAQKRASAVAKLKQLGGRRRKGTAVGLGIAGLLGYTTVKSNQREKDDLILGAIRDIQSRQQEIDSAQMARRAQEASYQQAINSNIDQVLRYAPDLYASVAAGRKLPQGGVVIGGAPRQDLLNELGRAMADGRFSR